MLTRDGVAVTKLEWTAPTENTDGTPIDYELSYNLYIDGVNTIALPGTLNPDGSFMALLADIAALAAPATYVLTLTAFSVAEPGLESVESSSITIIRRALPLAPSDVDTD